MARSSAEIRAEIIALESEFQKTRNAEISGAREQVLSLMKQYDLTLEDIKTARAPVVRFSPPLPPVFRNELGETWSGRGRAPKWLEGKDREQYRIKQG